MTIGGIVDYICGKIGKTDTNTKAKAKGFVQHRYEILYQKRLWIDSLLTYAVTGSDRVVVFPEKVGEVLAARTQNSPLANSSLMAEMQMNPQDFENEGAAMRIAVLTPLGVSAIVADSDISIEFDAADTSTVTVYGEDENGAQQKKTVTGNGTTPVSTGLTWRTIFTLSRSASTTTLTAKDLSDSSTILTLDPDQTSKRFQRIQLFSKPQASDTFTFLCKRAWSNLYDDSETPILAGCEPALVAYAQGDLLELLHQYGKAQAKFSEAMALESQFEQEQVWQRANQQVQVVPEMGGDVDWGYTNYQL